MLGGTGDDLQVEAGEVREEGARVGEVDLRDDEQRRDARVEGRDEVPVDEPRSRLRVGGGDDDEQLVGVGDDDALDGVGVVGTAPQQGAALVHAHDAGKRALVSRDVADEVDAVSRHDRLLAQLTGSGRGHRALVVLALVDEHGVAASVDRRDARDDGVIVGRPLLRARPVRLGVRPSAVIDVVVLLVRLLSVGRQPAHGVESPPFVASMRCHSSGNCGSVFAVVPMSSISMSSTASPTMAPAVAMR